jgi:hypothetical protein
VNGMFLLVALNSSTYNVVIGLDLDAVAVDNMTRSRRSESVRVFL